MTPASAETPTNLTLAELRDVRAGYGGIEVLHGVDLKVNAGTVTAVLGPNGAGKSTSLKVLAGLMAPTRGQVLVAGRDVTGASADALARAGLILVPEGKGIFPNLTVRENLNMVQFVGQKLADVEAIAYAQFPRLGERRKQMAGTLSGGEQQMLAMARGLASNPAVLILDELSMGLAPLIVEELYGVVADFAATGTAILVVEQFAHAVMGVADRAVLMVHGRVIAEGTPEELKSELGAAYLGGSA